MKTKPSSSLHPRLSQPIVRKIAIEEVKCQALAFSNARRIWKRHYPALEEAMQVSGRRHRKETGLAFLVLKVPLEGREKRGTSAKSCLHKGPVLPPEVSSWSSSSSLFSGSGISEQEGHRRDQVIRTAPAQVEMVLQAVMILRGNDPTCRQRPRGSQGRPGAGR